MRSKTVIKRWDTYLPYLRIEGKGARTFLQGQLTADLRGAVFGDLTKSCWLTSKGNLRALLEIRFDNEGADIGILAGEINHLAEEFEKVIFPSDQVNILGKFMFRRLQTLEDNSLIEWISTECKLPIKWEQTIKADLDGFHLWRLERGLPFGHNEINSELNPLELGLSSWISFDKGCYLGQETIARMNRLGNLKRELRYWTCKDLVSPGESVNYQDTYVGKVLAAYKISSKNSFVGLALIKRKWTNEPYLFGPKGQKLDIKEIVNYE